MGNKALIFGSSGQDGFYLNQILKYSKIDVICVSRSSGDIKGDIGNFDFVYKIINDYEPNFIFHLAAISSTSDNQIQNNFISIIAGTFNILESLRRQKLNTKVFIEEWNKEIRVMLEEAGTYEESGFRYVNGRQTKLILIGDKKRHLGN